MFPPKVILNLSLTRLAELLIILFKLVVYSSMIWLRCHRCLMRLFQNKSSPVWERLKLWWKTIGYEKKIDFSQKLFTKNIEAAEVIHQLDVIDLIAFFFTGIKCSKTQLSRKETIYRWTLKEMRDWIQTARSIWIVTWFTNWGDFRSSKKLLIS